MMITASEFSEELLAAINDKDAQLSLTKVQQYKEYMKDPAVGADFVNWIVVPVNLTKVHKALAEDLKIPPHALSIARKPMSRTQRAVYVISAMEISIKRVHNL